MLLAEEETRRETDNARRKEEEAARDQRAKEWHAGREEHDEGERYFLVKFQGL
jgi:hypothetical protein